ncbi:MAG: hypothetical protein Q8M32_12425 [Brevundimonas sp.]|nr:hypothetical protein [Brevundimonas sp.]MDZ4052443.1 hypothetical protein [Phenylobacterium sp.]
MTQRRHPTDRHLAPVFCANARSFHEMARSQRDRRGGASAYYLAIAVELGLKAYLLHRGITDQWNREHLRHDLTKALKCVRRVGLKGIPEGIRKLADVLGPLYASGARSRDLASPAMPMPPDEADQAISGLLMAIEAIIADGERGGG